MVVNVRERVYMVCADGVLGRVSMNELVDGAGGGACGSWAWERAVWQIVSAGAERALYVWRRSGKLHR